MKAASAVRPIRARSVSGKSSPSFGGLQNGGGRRRLCPGRGANASPALQPKRVGDDDNRTMRTSPRRRRAASHVPKRRTAPPQGCTRRRWQSSAELAGRHFARRRSPEAPRTGSRAGTPGRRRYVRHPPPKPAPSMHAPPPAPAHHSIRHRPSGPFGRRLQVRRCARPFRRAIRPRSGVRQVRRRSTRPMPRDHRKRFRPEGRHPSVRRPLWPHPAAIGPQNENPPDGCHSLPARPIHPPISARVGRVGKRPFRPAEPVGNRSRVRLKSVSGMLGDVVELDRRCGMTGGGIDQGPRIRVAGMASQCRRR